MDELQNDILEQTEVEETTENEVEDTSSSISPEKFSEALAQKKHWREKALKEAEARKQLEAQLAKVKPQAPQIDTNQFATKDEIATMQLSQMGHDSDTISAIKTYAKGAGKNPLEVLNDLPIKAMLDAKQRENTLADATPSSNGRTVSVAGKTLAEMSKSERKANWSEIVKKASK